MGWSIVKFEAEGIVSFHEAKLEMEQGKVTIVYGENWDSDDDDKSNGSGKSGFLEILGFGISGSPLRKIKIGELVNDDCSSGFTDVLLFNKALDETMRIERNIWRKKSATVKVTINDDPDHTKHLTGTDEANEFILNKLGVSKDDLYDFFILTNSKTGSFLDASDTKKKEIINRFSNGKIVDKSISELEIDIDSSKSDVDEFQNKLDSLHYTKRALKETLNESIEALKKPKEDEEKKEDPTIKFTQLIAKEEKEIILAKEEIYNCNLDLIDINKEISEFPDSSSSLNDLSLKEKSIEKLKDSRENLRDEVRSLTSEISIIEAKISGAVECPKCSHEFDLSDKDFNIKDAEKELDILIDSKNIKVIKGKALSTDISNSQLEIDEIRIKIKESKKELDKLNSEKDSIISDKNTETRRVDNSEAKIESWKLTISQLIESQKQAENAKPVDTLTPIRNKISQVEKEVSETELSLKNYSEEYDDFVIQLDHFKRFKSYLANKSLKAMEYLTNIYLEDIGSDIFIELNDEKKNANGSIKEKISANLIRNGIDIGSINKRSNGEKASISLALSKTLSHLINLNAGENKGVDFTLIDERLDAIDASGMTKIVRAYEKSESTVMLITHIPLPQNVGNPITIVKENDVSRILIENE